MSKNQKTRISFAPRYQWTRGNLPVGRVYDKQALKTTASKYRI